MENTTETSSADIQREIDADRERIEARIGAIQERMSPGQLVDEVLAYAKGSGGGEFVSNLGKSLKSNPVPVALMGISLAWLMAKGTSDAEPAPAARTDDRPLYYARGSVRRIGAPEETNGQRFSHFADEAGERFKALTDKAGNRAGDFTDAAGRTYRGFADASGKQISAIADEAGSLLDASTGWASDTWQHAKDMASDTGRKIGDAASSLSGSASSVQASIKDQSAQLNDAILTHFRDQPLVGGALAFALGAAIGAALPHTDKENEILGEQADALKATATAQASDLVEQGKDIASDVYDKAVHVAADVHDVAKERIVAEVDRQTEKTSTL